MAKTLVRIAAVRVGTGTRVRLDLTDGTSVDRDLAPFLRGRVFDRVRTDPAMFATVRVEAGALAWENGADLCPDAVILGEAAAGDDESITPGLAHSR